MSLICKDDVRNAKQIVKESTSWEKSALTIDLHSNLTCPKPDALAMYYKANLQVHNFTNYELNNTSNICKRLFRISVSGKIF